MQVNHFYTDPMPTVRNPLDSIVLDPESVKYTSYNLQNARDEFSDYHSILPSPSSCLLHGDGNCRKRGRLAHWVLNILILGRNKEAGPDPDQGGNK